MVAASGRNGTSAGFRSAAILIRYLIPLGSQIPSRFGLPSAILGVGAVRLGSPFGSRGMPGVFTLHCAAAGRVMAHSRTQAVFINRNYIYSTRFPGTFRPA